MPHNVYDKDGNKIGEVRSPGEDAVGAVLFLYLLWKALPGFLVLGLIGLVIYAISGGASLLRTYLQYGTIDETAGQTHAANISALEEASQAIAEGDYYVAASIVRTVLASEPDNEQALSLIQQLSNYTTGSLVTGGRSGVYYPFSSAETLPFIAELKGDLRAVSLDGQVGFITTGSATFLLDFRNGSFTHIDAPRSSTFLLPDFLSPDFTKLIKFDPTWGSFVGIYDVRSGSEIFTSGCASGPGVLQWMRNSRFLTGVDGSRSSVALIDTLSNTCRIVQIPGLGYESAVVIAPDESQLFIVTPGNFTAVDYAELFATNVDGTGIRRIAEVPVLGREETRILLAPDGSAIYFPEGYMISTRTGRVGSAIGGAIAWVDTAPPQAVLPQPQIIVTPPEGPRGTRFSFQMVGGLPGLEVSFAVLDANGEFTSGGLFAEMNTDINTPAGQYTVQVYADGDVLASATFLVTEP
ncbi:MAG: hypothetical protein MN733_36080 [Nitrososphaera sp.]|nr:hypothetical protein [Nitrososphaera sp.]